MNSLKKKPFDHWLLFGIIAIAGALRFWNFSEMQFMHDEVSAILRSTAGSFSELIHKQTTTDVHPVGVPIFLHYWVMMFGRSEFAVRFPFIIFGLISIYYSYKIAEKWFNPTVGIFVAVFLATLQCPTMYGQLARPYATGMMFSAIMCWCWTEFFFGEKAKQNRNAVGFVVFAALCCYNHYFSLLFAAIVGLSGFFFVNRENWKKYALCTVLVALLFIPHISILVAHLSMGSGGEESWLGRPQPDWLILFIKYLFHYSMMVGVLVLTVIGCSFYFITKNIREKNKLRVLALIWALLGPLLAYIYSVLGTPVLQFSSFTFSLPFLLMFLFSFYGEMNKGMKATMVVLAVLVNVYSLFRERQHYPLFYKHPYEQMALIAERTVASFGEKNVSVALSAMPGFVEFYFEKHGKKFDYLKADYADMPAFLAFLEKQRTEYFVAGNLTGDMIELVRERYPYILSKDDGFTYSIYCFSRNKPAEEVEEKEILLEVAENVSPGFRWALPPKRETDTVSGRSYWIVEPDDEYSASFTVQLSDVIYNRHSMIITSATLSSPDSAADPVLVIDIHDSKGPIWWRGTDYVKYNSKPDVEKTIYTAELLSGFDFRKHPYGETKIYLWNRGRNRVRVHRMTVRIIETNPKVYGLYEAL